MSLIRIVLTAGLMVLAVACSRDAGQAPGASSVPMADAAAQARAFSADPWLRERLPADAIAYVRLPSPWRAALGPGGKNNDRMFQSQAYVDTVSGLRSAMAKDPVSGEAALPLTGLLYRLNSPIEVAVVAVGRMASPAANVFATAVLDYPDSASLAAVLSQAGDAAAPLVFDNEGYASLPASGAPVFIHFDSASKRVSLLGGMFANLDSLKALRKLIADGKVEPRAELAMEREIDANGQGLIVWADVEALRPILSGAASDPVAKALLDQTKRVAFGWGSVAGQGRLSLRAEISGATWTRYLPQSPRKLDLNSSGTARMLFTAGLPTAADLQRIQAALPQEKDPQLAQAWQKADQELKAATGLTMVDWLAPFGPDAAIFGDDAGEFLAVRLADPAALQKLLDVLVDKLKAKHQVHTRAGQQIHQLRLPSLVDMAKTIGSTTEDISANPWMQIYARAGTHLYWLEQDGWLIVSGVPQPLLDRLALGAQQSLASYQQAAGADPGALLSAAGVATDAARQTYYSWLGLLVSMADLGGAEVDLMTLPTARELALPRETPLSANVHMSPTRLQVELNYGQHPMEWMGGSDGMTVVAVAGILAAIAIPAYDDYTLRAKVALALAATAPLKIAVSEHYASHGALPEDTESLGIELPISTEDGSAEISLDNGAIAIHFSASAPAKLIGKYLYVLPAQSDDESFEWRCGNSAAGAEDLLVEMADGTEVSDVPERYLPAYCR